IQHAGNYTSHALKPAPPVYDPVRVAQVMVQLAIRPKSIKYVGSASLALKFAHALFPELMTKMTGGVMRTYFKTAQPLPPTSGNLFNTVDYGMSTHGGWGIPGKSKAYRKYLVAALAAGLMSAAVVSVLRSRQV
ncbi:MAG: family oxidoreductase, partial [Mucilaginibacter sp.]|nr:family oxidoreductase [Mucilaginibacter sp.]